MAARRVRNEDAPAYEATPETMTQSERLIVAQATAILERAMERGEAMASPDAAGKFAAMKLHGLEREHFGAMFMDTRHRLIAWEVLFMGTVDGCEVHPREVVKRALALNAAAVILAHNHPSGSAEPSAADRAVTARLKQALGIVDVRLLDHFVVGDGAPVSLAARGWV